MPSVVKYANSSGLNKAPRSGLQGGADIRFIQAMLGHEGLEATHIYTRVSVRALRNVHAATHPTARLEPRPADEPPATAEQVGALHVRADAGDDDNDDGE